MSPLILYSVLKKNCLTLSQVSSAATILTGKREAQWYRVFNKRREARVATMANILGQLRNIKMIGLSTALSNYLQKQRKSEVDALLKERSLRMMEFSFSKSILWRWLLGY